MNRNFDASAMSSVHELKCLRLCLAVHNLDPLTVDFYDRKRVRRMNQNLGGVDYARLAVLEGR